MKNFLVADFETPAWKYRQKYQMPYLCGIYNGRQWNYFIAIDKFMKYLFKLWCPTIFFHNLGFDGVFIITYLETNHFKQETIIDIASFGKNKGYYYDYLTDGGKNFYYIKVYICDGRYYTLLEFRCSYKVLSCSVANLGSKGIIDYEKYYHFTNKKEVPIQLLTYCEQDCRIVYHALEKFYSAISVNKYTAGSISYHTFLQNFTSFEKKWYFGTRFQSPLSFADWEYLHYFYRGGFDYINPVYLNKNLTGNIKYYDVNRLYPYIMMTNNLPYGKMLDDPPRLGTFITLYQILITSAHIKPNAIPFIPAQKSAYGRYHYLPEIKNQLIYLTDQEWILMKKFYNIVAHRIIKKNYFCSKPYAKKIISKWINNRLQATNEGEGRSWKIICNSLYGMFGKKRTRTSYQIISNSTDQKNWKWQSMEMEEESISYIPTALITTSYARCLMIKNINKFKESFIFCHTDSIIAFNSLALPIHPTKSGYFKEQYSVSRLKILKLKCYLMEINYQNTTELKRVIGSLSRKSHNTVNWKNFNYGNEFTKLAKKYYDGGIFLVPQPYHL